MLDCFQPRARAAQEGAPPRRMVCICTPLGLHPADFFPTKPGPDYDRTPHLEVFGELRKDFTVISGLSHPEVGSSHDSIFSFLTGAPHPEIRSGFRNSISLDQFAAEQIGGLTRFPCLSLSAEGFGLSWTRSGAFVPSDLYPANVFARMFLEGRPDEVQLQRQRLSDGRSILDMVREQARQMQPVLLAGGGFRHGQHLAFDPDSPPPLSNLYLSMLHRLGIHADKFASSTGTLTGLES